MVPPRLERNAKLHRQLSAHRSDFWAQVNSGLWIKTTALPFDGEKLTAYIGYVVRGLMWWHWKVYLDDQCFVLPMCVTQDGQAMVRSMLGLNANARVAENLGNGTIEYVAAQGIDRPDISVWLFDIYGGLVLADASAQHSSSTTTTAAVAALTGPKRAQLNSIWRTGDGGLTLGALFPISKP